MQRRHLGDLSCDDWVQHQAHVVQVGHRLRRLARRGQELVDVGLPATAPATPMRRT